MTLRSPPAMGLAVFLLLPAVASAAASSGNNGTKPAVNRDVVPTVIHAARHDVSAPMRDIIRTMPPSQPMGTEEEPYAIPNILLKLTGQASRRPTLAGHAQNAPNGLPAPDIDLSFETISATTSMCGCLPPDTNGDVSDAHYIQWVNTAWQAFDKTTGDPATETPSPVAGNSFFVGFGGKCETTNSGDPLALWDPQAERWVMSQFVTSTPYAQCVAVSTTSDPFGTYNRYEFDWPRFGDYPKMGIWTDETGSQDAYLLITHEFTGNSFNGAALIALERDKMLTGDPTAAMLRYPGFDAYGVQPINLTGSLPAPANACPSFVHYDDSTLSGYRFWDLCLDWTTPANSTISSATHLDGIPFAPYGGEVPQLGTANGLDSFGSNLMYRANARAFPAGAPTRVSLVLNHTVTGDAGQAGIAWAHIDLDDDGANPTVPTPLQRSVVDEGIYTPDETNRWMGGIAIDGSGNIAVGMSQSSGDIHPQIQITGRTLEDPAGQLRDEVNCVDGLANGSQTSSSNRWGDYSSMSVDPVDQCTFYFTTEYYPTTAGSSWHTRVCSFKYDSCGQPDFALVADSARRVEMCSATSSDPTYSLRVGVLNGFTGATTLTANGVPTGATASFSDNPINAPGTSVLTLSGATGVASGEYAMSVDATGGSITRSLAIELGISSSNPSMVTPSSPLNNATGVVVYPVLDWSGNDRIFGDGFDGTTLPPVAAPTDAVSFTVEVATDPAFANIVASAEVTTTSWQVDSALDATTQYYWRVTPHNYCGDGPVSVTSTFTTGEPGTCPAGTTATVVYEDDFENGTNGWTAGGTGSTAWTQGTPASGTGMSTTAWLIPNNSVSSDRTLTTPSIAIPAGAAAVFASYDAYHKFEDNGTDACWDESIIESSTDGTTFSYLDGTHMLTDPYNGAASNDTALGSTWGWCYPGPGGSSAPTHAVVDMSSFEGQSAQLRFRAVTDGNTTATAPNGFIIDNFKVEACQ